uniref:TLC domain containing 3A n=1 Tax=Junco hyemalis TaxID=40217 RepID=A0A8C5IJM9_JUNHY
MWRTLALASAFFPGLFILCIRLLRWAAPALSLKDRILLSGRLVSTVQAAMATVSGITVMLSCKNVVHDRHWLAVEYVWVLVPYMTYDIYVMYLCHWHKSQEKGILEKKHSLASVWSFLLQERLMVTHHLFILIVLTPITQHFRGELGDFFVGCIFTAELSTPFVSLGKILMQVGQEGRGSGLGSPQLQFIPFPCAPLQAWLSWGCLREEQPHSCSTNLHGSVAFLPFSHQEAQWHPRAGGCAVGWCCPLLHHIHSHPCPLPSSIPSHSPSSSPPGCSQCPGALGCCSPHIHLLPPQLKMQDTLLHKVNGIIVLVTFFLCRILLFPFMYAAYGRQVGIPAYLVPFRIPLHCNIANASLIAPQLYWFTLICRKAARLYRSSAAHRSR